MYKRVCHDPKNEEMFARYKRCLHARWEVYDERSFTKSEKFYESLKTDFVCMPRFESMEEAFGCNYMVDHEAEYRKENSTTTLFKIPIHVNDIESYVKMLVRKHYDQL